MALKLRQMYIRQYTSFNLLTTEEDELRKKIDKNPDKLKKLHAKNVFLKAIEDFPVYQIRTISSHDNNIDEISNSRFHELVSSNKIISMFENDVLRYIESAKPNLIHKLGKDKLFVDGIIELEIQSNHLEMVDQIISKGIVIKNDASEDDGTDREIKMHYVFFTASAGQQRNNKLIMLEQSIHNEFLNKYMCGLTPEIINKKKVNSGKYLAYTALPLSASLPVSIDIDKVIVVNDLELMVNKEVEYIDHETFEHKLITLPDPLNQTDGAGMILPTLLKDIQRQLNIDYSLSGAQIRCSWIKGALFPFQFNEFCEEYGKCSVIDLYGIEHDVIAEGIQIILTKSQFKMYSMYETWDEYKRHFKGSGLTFSITAVNNVPKETVPLTYQYLQTLGRGRASDTNIAALCEKSTAYIKSLHNDKDAALKLFGVTADNKIKKPLQEALSLYPALINDKWVQKQIRGTVNAYRRRALGGRIEVPGFYGYAMPDMYAFCEYLFLGHEKPKGLIPDNFVYCHHYADRDDIEIVDVLRSPHLSNEHTIRNLYNVGSCKKWFGCCGQNVIYSVHDYVMLSVMGDVDGDTLLITPSQELLNLVESHNVLYYRMFKADPEEINEKTLAAALKRSYQNNSKGKSINFIANTITKVWNKDNVNESDIRTIQHFTALSNSSIDYPKTQKIIGLPEDDERVYQNMLDEKSPYYFRWVKNKKKDSVNQTNNSMVNRINNHVAKETNDLRYKYEGVQDFEYSMLQRRNVNGEVTVKRDEKYKDIYGICNIYGSRSQILTQKLKKIAEDQVKDNEEVIDGKYDLLHSMCLNDLLSVYSNKGRGKDGYQKECMADLANIMVDICYCQIQKPIDIFNTLWSCVGETLVENIVLNLGNESYARKTRSRMAYTTEKIKAVDDKKRKLQEYIDESHVDIYRSDFEVVSSINVKGAKPETVANLRKLYFVLLCLCKGSKSHRIIIKRGKKTKMNNAKLMRMIGLSNDNISTMLEKLEGFGLINIEKSKINSDKSITLKNVRFIKQTAENVIFTVKNVYSPIIYYQAFKEGKKINECVICGRDFLKVGNKKTCSDSCAKKLEAISKHENYVSKTAAEIGEFQ